MNNTPNQKRKGKSIGSELTNSDSPKPQNLFPGVAFPTEYPNNLTPKIVTQKDRTERDNLPLCMDWGNYSARWLARFNLGLHQILLRLVAQDEVTASDPTLLQMTAIALNCAAHVKAILGFTIPSDCKPIWLLGTIVEQLGLKLTFRKQGKRGQQVKLFSLSKKELEFALYVIAHRVALRQQKENLTYYATEMQSQYSVNPNPKPVSTPPHNAIGNSHCPGGDTTDFEKEALVQGALSKGDRTEKDSTPPVACLPVGVREPLNRSGGRKNMFRSATRQESGVIPPSEEPPAPCLFVEPPSLDRTTLFHCVEILRSGIALGVEAIKGILKRWTGDLRWETVLSLEAIALDELRFLEDLVPDFYALLNEEVLPMEA